MNFLKKLFVKKDDPIKSYDDFWKWFRKHERDFFNTVKNQNHIDANFFQKLSPKLEELKDGFYYVTGMYNDNTCELILTVDGSTKNIVFVEELVDSAPNIDGWKFTALKPELNLKDANIELAGYKFNKETLRFFANELPDYPDEIDITVVHNDLTEDNRSQITNGIYIFLDNYLGELNFLTTIDNLTVAGANDKKDLIPMEKLKDFLLWRQKEFIEKYEGVRYDTEKDNYSVLEAELQNGRHLIAVINKDLLTWDRKPSHPWISKIKIKYDGETNNGMPHNATYQILDEIEATIMQDLKDFDGYLNIGRQTADNVREIYFACKDFRRPSKVFNQIQRAYADKFEIDYNIYKDKYWQSFERFN